MRRTLLVLTVALVMAATVAASALSVAAQGEGETGSQEGSPCFLMEPGLPNLFTNDPQAVITPSGNTKFTCHFEGPPIAQTTVGKGFQCGTPLGPTTESHYVYTKSGNATLTCRINPGG
jgi:hypothetical protein